MIFLSSCAGYNIKYESNPFLEYNISSVTVPMFLNRTVLPGISGSVTTQIKRVLHQDTSLKIYSGNDKRADAVLVGILDSADNRSEVIISNGSVFTDGSLEKSIGSRNQFYISNANRYGLTLKLVLIKKPTKQDMILLQSSLGEFLSGPKVVFHKTFSLTGSFSRVVKSTEDSDSAGIVNFTTNKEVFRKSIDQMARSAAGRFQEEILYAF